jgi:hypothetical protein
MGPDRERKWEPVRWSTMSQSHQLPVQEVAAAVLVEAGVAVVEPAKAVVLACGMAPAQEPWTVLVHC